MLKGIPVENEALYRPLFSFCWGFGDDICYETSVPNSIVNFLSLKEKLITDPVVLLTKSENSIEGFFKNEAGGFVDELRVEDFDMSNWLSITLKAKNRKANKSEEMLNFNIIHKTNLKVMMEIAVPPPQFKLFTGILGRNVAEKKNGNDHKNQRYQLIRIAYNYPLFIEWGLLSDFLENSKLSSMSFQNFDIGMLKTTQSFFETCAQMLRGLWFTFEIEKFQEIHTNRKVFSLFVENILRISPSLPLTQKFLILVFLSILDYLQLYFYVIDILKEIKRDPFIDLLMESNCPKVWCLMLRSSLGSVISMFASYFNRDDISPYYNTHKISFYQKFSAIMPFDSSLAEKNDNLLSHPQLLQICRNMLKEKKFIAYATVRNVIELRVNIIFIVNTLQKFYDNSIFINNHFTYKRESFDSLSSRLLNIRDANRSQIQERHLHKCKVCKTAILGLATISACATVMKHKWSKRECHKSDWKKKELSAKGLLS